MDRVEERLASFYVGQEYDLVEGELRDETVHYDARDLTTHAVCLGMTGSGKTGLGVILLEEAALDGVPSLVIDPKGDMTNLLLTFPDLGPEDFRPWINPDDARRKDLSPEAYATRMADLWSKGLAGTGQGPERIRSLKAAADFHIYTPGSSAGRQVSILHTLKAPSLSWESDTELLHDKVESVVSALLALVGIEADPVRSREHILLSNIFENAWREGEDLDLAQLILRVQTPPFSQLGVFPVDTFFPEKDRMELAMLLNGLVASPTFGEWMKGYPLDIDMLLYGPGGKPQVSVLYIAHLSEEEKQFFVTLLLEQVVSWMRSQSGTTSLRALIYMDEMFGYLPPHPSNPPTKKPLLTLLKQARAFGLGLILATQNPVDLDYKALSNAGTWFIGRMQADRDKQRLLDGLEGVQVGKGGTTRAEFDRMISAVKSRVFLLHNVHEREPVVFHTRWAMSYLRGPMTRNQVRELAGVTDPTPAYTPEEPAYAPRPAERPVSVAAPPPPAPPAPPPEPELPYNKVPPQLPSAVKQVYLPPQISLRTALAEFSRERRLSARAQKDQEGHLIYEPTLVGLAQLRFPHTRSRQTHSEEVSYLLPVAEAVADWSEAKVQLEPRDLEDEPEQGAYFVDLPSELGAARSLSSLRKDFEDFLYYNSAVTIWFNPHLKLYSKFDETFKAFERRCRGAAKKAHDAELKKLRTKYKTKLDRLEAALRREERELEDDKIELDARKQEELLSGVESVFGLFAGRKSSRRLSSASRKRRMTRQAKADVEESEKVIEELEDQIDELEEEAKLEVQELMDKWGELIEEVEEIEVRPRRADVQINVFALAWTPRWEVTIAGQAFSMPAYEVEQV
jgi:DNA helicase HerA-like ATPase